MNDIRVTQDLNGGAIAEVVPGLIRADTAPTKVGIPCLICGKVLETGMGSYCLYPYVCDECKEAVAYAKQLMKESRSE
jgi:hypothetical protein